MCIADVLIDEICLCFDPQIDVPKSSVPYSQVCCFSFRWHVVGRRARRGMPLLASKAAVCCSSPNTARQQARVVSSRPGHVRIASTSVACGGRAQSQSASRGRSLSTLVSRPSFHFVYGLPAQQDDGLETRVLL